MTLSKIKKIRHLLGVPEGIPICKHLCNQAEAHDYAIDDMPDDIFMEIIQDKDDYGREYRKVKGFE